MTVQRQNLRKLTRGPAGALVACALAMLFFAFRTPASPLTAEQILEKVRQAAATVAYEGVREVVFVRGGVSTKVKQKVYHATGRRERFETIEPARAAGNLAVCDGQQMWRYFKKRNEVYVLPMPPPTPGLPPPTRQGRVGPRWKLLGEETVAGRPCWIIGLVTSSGQRIAQLSVDKQKFVVLAASHKRMRGQAEERWRFLSINFSPNFRPQLFTFKPPPGVRVIRMRGGVQRMPLADAERVLGFKAIIPRYLPPGFKLVRERVAVVRKGRHAALWLIFSNGAKTFSIFQSRRLPASATAPRVRARWDVGPFTLLVVGDVSEEELAKMRASLPPPPQPLPGRRPGPGRPGRR